MSAVIASLKMLGLAAAFLGFASGVNWFMHRKGRRAGK